MRKKPPGAAVPLIAVDRESAKPLHRQIYDSFRAMILDRRLQSGQQIPSTRALANELGISRIPVLGAYSQLLAEGYIESRAGAGTFVTASLSDRFPARSDQFAARPGQFAAQRAPSPSGDASETSQAIFSTSRLRGFSPTSFTKSAMWS